MAMATPFEVADQLICVAEHLQLTAEEQMIERIVPAKPERRDMCRDISIS
jgi:hypothetical protein